MRPVYFDLSVRDVDTAKEFFSSVLGWKFAAFSGLGSRYELITTGDPETPGINGGMAALADAPLAEGRPLTVAVIAVESIDNTIARVEAAGGKIVEPKVTIPGIGEFATCSEPGGLLFGLLQVAAEPSSDG